MVTYFCDLDDRSSAIWHHCAGKSFVSLAKFNNVVKYVLEVHGITYEFKED
jgi:hypothetical protein